MADVFARENAFDQMAPQDVSGFETAAGALNATTLERFGTDANPQALLDALRTGGTSSLVAAAQAGDPQFNSLLSGDPAGLPFSGQRPTNPTGGLDVSKELTQNLVFNWNDATQLDQLKTKAAESSDPQLKALGEDPTANLGYLNTVLGSTDHDRILRYQTFLRDKGFMDQQPSGSWDGTSQDALRSYMVARYLPEAVFGANRDQYSAFLSNAFGFDVQSQIKTLGYDNFPKDIFAKWLHTQDASKGRQSINDYLSKYGDASLPDDWKKLSGNWMDSFQDTLSGVPLLGHVISPIENMFNLDKLQQPMDLFEDNRDLRMQALTKDLSGTDQQALQGVIDTTQHSSGFFGALDAWNKDVTRGVLGIVWNFSDHGVNFGSFENPFSSASDFGRRMGQGENDLMGHLPFMQDYMREHDTLKSLLNFTAGIFDDPLTYAGVGWVGKGIGSAIKASERGIVAFSGESGRLTNAVHSVWTPMTAKDVLFRDLPGVGKGDVQDFLHAQDGTVRLKRATDMFTRAHLDSITTQKANIKSALEMSRLMVDQRLSMADRAAMLKLSDATPGLVKRHVTNLAAMKSSDQALQYMERELITANVLMDASYAHGWEEVMRGLSPVVAARMGAGKLQRILAKGGVSMSSPVLDLTTDLNPAKSVQSVALVLGMKPADARKWSDAIFTARSPMAKQDVLDQFDEAVKQHFTTTPALAAVNFDGKSGYEAFQSWQRRARGLGNDERPIKTPIYAVQQKTFRDTGQAKEASLRRPKSAGLSKGVQGVMDQVQAQTDRLIEQRDAIINEATVATYGGDAERLAKEAFTTEGQLNKEWAVKNGMRDSQVRELEQLDSQIADGQKMLTEAGGEKGGPAFTGQLLGKGYLGVTPAEVVAFMNPRLRTMEAMQRRLAADSFRSLWVNSVISRPATTLRIVLGDEIARFALTMMMEGHFLTASRYLGTQFAGLTKKLSGRGGSLQIPEEFGWNVLQWAGMHRPNDFAVYDATSKHYATVLPHYISHIMATDHFLTHWNSITGRNLEERNLLRQAERMWGYDPAGAEELATQAEKGLQDKGYEGQAVQLRAVLDGWHEEHAKKLQELDQLGPGARPQFDRINLRRVVARAPNDDKELVRLVRNAEGTRRFDAVNSLRQYLRQQGYRDSLSNLEMVMETMTPKVSADLHHPISFQEVRSSLENFHAREAENAMHRMILTTPTRLREQRDLAAWLEQHGSFPTNAKDVPAELQSVWRDWRTDARLQQHDTIPQKIRDYIQYVDPQGLYEQGGWSPMNVSINEMRNTHGIGDLRSPHGIARQRTAEYAEQQLNHSFTIDHYLPQAKTEDDLRMINQLLREEDPNIGEWKGDFDQMKTTAELQRNAFRAEGKKYMSPTNGPQRWIYKTGADWAHQQHGILTEHMADPRMQQWVMDRAKLGDGDAKEWEQQLQEDLRGILRKQAYGSDYVTLPTISQPIHVNADHPWRNKLNQGFDWYHHNVTNAAVQYARYTGFEELRRQYIDQMAKYKGLTYDHAHEVAFKEQHPEIVAMANSRAWAWVEQNTYSGQRTVMGTALRNAFPFWGATANMNRFWYRTLAQHRKWQTPALQTLNAVDITDSQGGEHVSVPYSNHMLGLITGADGDQAQVDPLKPFFFTSDGVTGFIPGMGPQLSYGLSFAASHDPHLVDGLMEAMGPLGEQYRKHISDRVDNPVLGWLATGLGGAYESATGRPMSDIPFVSPDETAQSKLIDSRARDLTAQRDTAGQGDWLDPKQAAHDAGTSVGHENLAKSLLQFVLPLGVTSGTEQEQNVNTITQQWDQATNIQAKNTVLGQAYGKTAKAIDDAITSGDIVNMVTHDPQNPANLLLYFDRRVNEDDKRSIAFHAPWVVDYATSKYKSLDSQPQIFNSAKEFNASLSSGNEAVVEPGAYMELMRKNRRFNQASAEYGALKQQEYDFLLRSGVNTSSAVAKAWRTAYFEPEFRQIARNYPEWASQFASMNNTTVEGLDVSTRPLRTLMQWEVIPPFDVTSGFKDSSGTPIKDGTDGAEAYRQSMNQKITFWRQTMSDLDNAATAIRELRSSTGPQQSKTGQEQQILLALQGRLAGYAAQNPQFANELNQFHFGRVDDIVRWEMDTQEQVSNG